MSTIRELGSLYVQVRRIMGFQFKETERLLHRYFRFLEDNHYPSHSLTSALEWIGAGSTPGVQGRRANALRPFVRWAQAFEPTLELIPKGVAPYITQRSIPYIYTPEQVAALMDHAARIVDPFRAATYWTVLGLLACTGMRVGEVLNLDRDDIRDGLMHINESKFGKSRVIPIDQSTATVLENYRILRDTEFRRPATEAFFVSLNGTRLIYNNVHRTVHQFVQDAGIEAIAKDQRPRIHDLRHTFATHTIRDAYLTGLDPARILPILATYLGHISIQNTYWYLEAEPGLLNAAASRLPSLLDPNEGTP
jgi:integrase/recombinase XerD